MILGIRPKVVFLLSLLVLVSVVAGFFIGIILSSIIAKKKEEPAFMKKTTMQNLGKLNPTSDQKQKFEMHTDQLVSQISDVRRQARDAMNAFYAAIDKELTPEQRQVFEKKIKPKEKQQKQD